MWWPRLVFAVVVMAHTFAVDSAPQQQQQAPVLAGPFSGTWWSVGTGNATAITPDSFHLGRYGDAVALLNRPGSTVNGAYGLRLDLTRDEGPSNWTGYGCSVAFTVSREGNPVKLWYVELLKGQAAAYHTVGGQWQETVSASTPFPNGTTFELEVHNDAGAFNASLSAIVGSTAQVVFSTENVPHDGRPTDHGNITVGCTDQTAALVSQVFVSRPLVPPLPRTSAAVPATKAVGGEHLEAWTSADGRVFVRSAGGENFTGVVTLSVEEADTDSKNTSMAKIALISTESVNATHFTQRYAVGNSGNGAHTAVLNWSLSTSHAGCTSAVECSILQDLKLAMSMETAVAQPRNHTFRLTARFEPTDAGFDPQALLSFRQRFDSVRGALPQQSVVSTLRPVDRVVYGTERMVATPYNIFICNLYIDICIQIFYIQIWHMYYTEQALLESELGATTSIDPSTGIAVRGSVLKHAYLPVVSVLGPALSGSRDRHAAGSAPAGSSGGYAILAEPRSSWVLRYGVSGLAASRLFFLGAQQGSTDCGYFNGDVETQ